MKRKALIHKAIIALFLIATSFSQQVQATSGKLKQASIINCNGTNYGHHGDGHWHVAVQHDSGWYPSGSSLGMSNPCSNVEAVQNTPTPVESPGQTKPSPPIVLPKSEDSSLSNVKVEGERISPRKQMYIETSQSEVLIQVESSHELARVVVDGPKILEVGENFYLIHVTAEDGSSSEYRLTVRRLSGETSFELRVNKQTIEFANSNKATLVVSGIEIEMVAKTADPNAQVQIEQPDTLEIGENRILITITAEDGTQEYFELIVTRLSDNLDITVWINGRTVDFIDSVASISVDFSIEVLNISWELSDNRATINSDFPELLEIGINQVNLTVTAENGEIQVYTIIVT